MEIHRHKSDTPFKIFQNPKKLEEFWNAIKDLFQHHNLLVFAVGIHESDAKRMYPNIRDNVGLTGSF